MDTSKEISATLESYQIQKIDKMYVPYEATRRLAQILIKAIIENPEAEAPDVTDEMKAKEEQDVREDLIAQGNQRFFSPDDVSDMTWKEMFKNLEWDLEIDITGEQKDNQSDMATLSTVLQTVVSNPQALENPKVKVIFNKILSKTGTVSPIELSEMESLPVAPSGGQVGAGMEQVNPNV